MIPAGNVIDDELNEVPGLEEVVPILNQARATAVQQET
jgi:hypothetical protein